MKKMLFFALFALSYTINAQNHSDLWLKIDEIRRTKFPETYQYKLDEKNFSSSFLTVTIDIDDKFVNGTTLDQKSLADIAGIGYILPTEKELLSIYGTSAGNGVILIYTHSYANANPKVRDFFKITFPAPELPENKNKKKK
ncbi:MAG: hypothetical protein SFU27_06245 [Thermonemataceae bacterium]|nr:hypothetical protein [Thermonemataceae bacterium]